MADSTFGQLDVEDGKVTLDQKKERERLEVISCYSNSGYREGYATGKAGDSG